MNFFKKKDQLKQFNFNESPNTACFVCNLVMDKTRPILYIAHDAEDGAWQFLCGQSGHTDENIKIISIRQATEIDGSINDLYEMTLGVGADRKSTRDKWEPFKISRK